MEGEENQGVRRNWNVEYKTGKKYDREEKQSGLQVSGKGGGWLFRRKHGKQSVNNRKEKKEYKKKRTERRK